MKQNTNAEFDEIFGAKAQPAPQNNQIEENKGKPLNFSNDVNVNIQIHIGADASSEQIEAIFKNMSTYLK